MPKLFIPKVGDILKLTQDWTFGVYWEGRNQGLITAAAPESAAISRVPGYDVREGHPDMEHFLAQCVGEQAFRASTWWTERKQIYATGLHWRNLTLKKGTYLRVDRVYVRRPQSGKDNEYNSISFTTNDGLWKCNPHLTKPKDFNRIRFWAKLKDVNEMYAVQVGDKDE